MSLPLARPSWPVVTRERPLTTTVEKPSPTFVFHETFGPSDGQVVFKPTSFDTPFTAGPRNIGQSSAGAERTGKSSTIAGNKRMGAKVAWLRRESRLGGRFYACRRLPARA